MTLVRSRSTDLFPHGPVPSTTRQLQEALYTHLDDLEKTAFIEALSLYGTRRDIFELVNSLRKTLNTPVKRQLFPLVRQVIRKGDVDAFDLLTRGDKQYNTMPRPYLYRPHMADLNVMKKQQAGTLTKKQSRGVEDTSVDSDRILPGGSSKASSHSTVKARGQHKSSRSRSRSRSPRTLRSRRGHDDVTMKIPEQHQQQLMPGTSANEEDEGELIEMDLGAPGQERSGFGFVIRGGHESGLGVYVSSVDHGSTAHRCGLRAGDLIVEANNINFRNISHEEAALLIQAANCLHLTVSREGRVPGSRTVHEAYRWTDPRGRPVSPPGGWDPNGTSDGFLADDEGRTRSGTLMLKGSDERKVNVVVERGHGLGLMVRGGQEYGLGVFVSSIDRYSVAENSGLKVGDQILDVNGRSLLNVTHAQAVRLLKSGRHLMMTVKDVGKIPFAKTTVDETGWIESTRVSSYARSVSSRLSESGSPTNSTIFEGFKRGPSTQLLPASLTTGQQQKELIFDQAKLLLNDSEQMTLNYYVTEYEKRTISLTGFAQALYQILNTPAKLTLLSEIRTIILPKELNTFDQIVLNRELDNSLTEARGRLAPDVISIGSFDSHDVSLQTKRTLFSQPNITRQTAQQMEKVEQPEFHPQFNLRESSIRMGGSTSSLNRLASRTPRRTRSPSPVSAYQLMVNDVTGRPQPAIETVPRATKGGIHKKMDEPSDDSGVEISGQFVQSGSPEFHQSHAAKSKLYQANPSKKYTSPQRRILSHLQQPINGRGGHVGQGNVNDKDVTNAALWRQRHGPNQMQHQALVHRDGDEDYGEKISGSIEELRFLNTNDGIAWKGQADGTTRQSRKGNNGGRRETTPTAQERSRSLQRGQRSTEKRPKSRARSSDPALTGRRSGGGDDVMTNSLYHNNSTRGGDAIGERDVIRHEAYDNGDLYATVDRRQRRPSRRARSATGRSQSPLPVTDASAAATGTWSSSLSRNKSKKEGVSSSSGGSARRGASLLKYTPLGDHHIHHQDDILSSTSATSTIVNSDNRRPMSPSTSKSPASTLRAKRRSPAVSASQRQAGTVGFINDPGGKNSNKNNNNNNNSNSNNRSNNSRSNNNNSSYGNTLAVPSASISPPLPRNTRGESGGTFRHQQQQQQRASQGNDDDEDDDFQLPPSNVLQKLGKSYRSVSPRKPPQRSPKISAHSVTSRKRLDSEFFRSGKDDHMDEGRHGDDDDDNHRHQQQQEQHHRLSYPSSSVESTPRGGNGFSGSTYPHHPHHQYRTATTRPSTLGDPKSYLQPKPSLQTTQERQRNSSNNAGDGKSSVSKSDKNSKSKVSVPLIKINSKQLPNVDAAFMKSSIRSRKSNPFQHDENTSANEKVTISDTPVEINDLHNNSFTSDRSNYSNSNYSNASNYSHSSSKLNGVNTSSITIHKPKPRPTMDGCLSHVGFKLPRPEVYTPVELAIMDDQNKIETIKAKAAERYGDIPLEVIYIYRSKPTLGVAIEGGANTRQPLPKVINVQPGGSAFESGGLKVGHVILEVNGRPAVGLSHMDAARLIAEAFKDKERDRMELLVTDWLDELLDVIKVDVGMLKVVTSN